MSTNLYTIPYNWIWSTLKETSNKIVDGSHNPPIAQESGFPMLSAKNILNNSILFNDYRFISKDDFIKESKRTKIKENDILLTIVGTIGRSSVIRNNVIFTVQRSVAVIGTHIYPNFLSYFFQSPYCKKYLEKNARGTAQKGIYLNQLQEIPIPLPPLIEQVRIVSKIEELFSRLDAGVIELGQTQRQFELYGKSILLATFKGYDCNLKIRDVSTLIQYGTSDKANIEPLGIPVLRMGNIQNMAIDFTNLKYMPQDWSHSELILNDGDLLFNRTNSAELVGKTAVYKKHHPRATFASYLIRVKLDSAKYDVDLLSYYINSSYGRAYIKSVVSQQVGQANVNGTKLSNMPIPNIPFGEQYRIRKELEKTFSIIKDKEEEFKKNIIKTSKLKQGILKKAFEGRLIPQNPSDEPASVLLEKIKAEKAIIEPSRRGSKNKNQMRMVE